LDPIDAFGGDALTVLVDVDPDQAGDAKHQGRRLHLYAQTRSNPLNNDYCGELVSISQNIPLLDTFVRPGGTYSFEVPFLNALAGNTPLVQNPIGQTGRPNPDAGEKFCIGFLRGPPKPLSVPDQSLFEPHVIIVGTNTAITGAEVKDDQVVAPANLIRVDPYIVQYSYDQIVYFDVCLNRAANVSFKILKAGIYNPTVVSSEIVAELPVPGGNPMAATSCNPGTAAHHFTWDTISEPDDRIYSFVVEATSIDLPLSTAVYRGFLDLRP
jgi:hypothetical protein